MRLGNIPEGLCKSEIYLLKIVYGCKYKGLSLPHHRPPIDKVNCVRLMEKMNHTDIMFFFTLGKQILIYVVFRSTSLVQIVISQQLLDGIKIFMVPRGYITMTLVIP